MPKEINIFFYTLLCDIELASADDTLHETRTHNLIIFKHPSTTPDTLSSLFGGSSSKKSNNLVRFRLCDPKSPNESETTTDNDIVVVALPFVMDSTFPLNIQNSRSELNACQTEAEKAFTAHRRVKRELYDDFTAHIMTLLWARKLVWDFMLAGHVCMVRDVRDVWCAFLRAVISTCRCDFLWPLIAVRGTCYMCRYFQSIDPLLLCKHFHECQSTAEESRHICMWNSDSSTSSSDYLIASVRIVCDQFSNVAVSFLII